MSNTKICLGTMKFTFTDENGVEFASFRMNPADPSVAKRCQEVAQHFSQRKDERLSDVDAILAYDQELTEKISYLLGYDVKQDLFREASATTVLPSGELFAVAVLDRIADEVKPEIEKRKRNMETASAKYLEKYKR